MVFLLSVMIKNGINIAIVHIILIKCLLNSHDFMYSEIKGSKANHTHLLFNANTTNKGKPSQRNLLKSITIEFIEKKEKNRKYYHVCVVVISTILHCLKPS